MNSVSTFLVTVIISNYYWAKQNESDRIYYNKKLKKEKDLVKDYYESRHPVEAIKYRRKETIIDSNGRGGLFQLVAYESPYGFYVLKNQSVEKAKDFLRKEGHGELRYIKKHWVLDNSKL